MATMLVPGAAPLVNGGEQQTVAVQVTPQFTRPVVKSYHPPLAQSLYVAPHPMGRPLLAQHIGIDPENVGFPVAHIEQITLPQQALANTKEKTPMCLVNELARFNKLQHQYTLTDEQGPAHKKTFYVKLQLGTEEYAAFGPSIKKAQHAAAGAALDSTQYKKPPHKPSQRPHTYSGNSLTPTVELNALAMKRGEPAVYKPLELPPFNQAFHPVQDYHVYNYNPRYQYPRYPRVFKVQLEVGLRKFVGEGPTRQAARHEAASKALRVLKALPMPRQSHPDEEEDEEEDEDDDTGSTSQCTTGEKTVSEFPKSEISQVHEIALKRGFNVNFEVVKEAGPPHMKLFVTKVVCGEFVCEAEGNSKKLSKKRAAEKLLETLRELPSLPLQPVRPKKAVQNKKKNRGLIKLQKASPEYGQGINPISRLIQIQQAKKEKEPLYTLKETRGGPVKRREFVMEVTVGSEVAQGVGPNKKLAKRNAAEAMLIALGYSRPMPRPGKPALKISGGSQLTTSEAATGFGDKRVTFVEGETVKQRIPGLLVMPKGAGDTFMRTKDVVPQPDETQDNATKQSLVYAAEIKGLKVHFTEFPKSGAKDFVCLVSLSTNPPQVCQGVGGTAEEALDVAISTAYGVLGQYLSSSTHDQPRAIVAAQRGKSQQQAPTKEENTAEGKANHTAATRA